MNPNPSIQLDMTAEEIIVAMSQGNPGALTTCMLLLTETEKVDPGYALGGVGMLLMLDDLKVYGSRMYMLWNDVCGRDITKVIALIRAYQLGIVSAEALNIAIDNYGEGIVPGDIVTMVAKKIPAFALPTHSI